MILKGTDGFQSFEFAPSSENGVFVIEDYRGAISEYPIHAPSISISSMDHKLNQRLEKHDDETLEVVNNELITPVEGEPGTYQVQSGLYVCANLVEPRRSLMGGFNTFTEVPAPDEPAISFAPQE